MRGMSVAHHRPPTPVPGQPRDLQRTFRLLLATVWLLDAALQLQPFMFTPGSNGFSGMLDSLAAGNPGWVTHLITWNASLVSHDPVLTNTLFASIQFLIAFGIAWKRTCKPALALSVAWAIGVWWFGEGLGNVLHGGATPFGGGPGAVLFYAVLAVVLWPSDGPNEPFVAARTVGPRAARALWTAIWLLLAVLFVAGAGRSPDSLHRLVASMDNGQPGWLANIDRWSSSVLLHHGTEIAISMAVLCGLVALSVYLSPAFNRLFLVLAVVAFASIWVAVENFGGILAGGATDPNSGPLLVLLALTYWPLSESTVAAELPLHEQVRVRVAMEA